LQGAGHIVQPSAQLVPNFVSWSNHVTVNWGPKKFVDTEPFP